MWKRGVKPWQTVDPCEGLLPPGWPPLKVLTIQEITEVVSAVINEMGKTSRKREQWKLCGELLKRFYLERNRVIFLQW
jgi:hypothetical protein